MSTSLVVSRLEKYKAAALPANLQKPTWSDRIGLSLSLVLAAPKRGLLSLSTALLCELTAEAVFAWLDAVLFSVVSVDLSQSLSCLVWFLSEKFLPLFFL